MDLIYFVSKVVSFYKPLIRPVWRTDVKLGPSGKTMNTPYSATLLKIVYDTICENGTWRKWHYQELYTWFKDVAISKYIKWTGLGWAGHMTQCILFVDCSAVINWIVTVQFMKSYVDEFVLTKCSRIK